MASMDAARFLRRQAWIVPRNAFECNHAVSPSLNRVGRASTTRSGRRGVVDVMPLRRPHLAGLNVVAYFLTAGFLAWAVGGFILFNWAMNLATSLGLARGLV